jgi:hypothetical protein
MYVVPGADYYRSVDRQHTENDMSKEPKTYSTTTFPLPPDYHGGMGLPDHIEVDPARELQGWRVDEEARTITLLYADVTTN